MAKSRNNRKKKKSVQAPKRLTPEQYIFRKARSLPIAKVYMSDKEAFDEGICNIIVLRQQPSGNYVMGVFLVDLFCLGIKDTFFRFGISWNEFVENFLEVYNADINILEETSPQNAQGIIKNSLEYAATLGISPHKEFKLTQYILDDMKIVKSVQVERPEKPVYASLRADYNPLVIAALNKSIGEGNYDVFIKDEIFDDEDWIDDEDFEAEENKTISKN